MSETVNIKEEPPAPQLDSNEVVIKLERCEDWEMYAEGDLHASAKHEDTDSLDVKQEPFEDQTCYERNGRQSSDNSEYFDNGALSDHFLEFSPRNRYNCKTCRKSFVSSNNLHRHELIHTRVKLECHVCGRLYVARESFDRHMLKHKLPRKVYPCDICHKTFKSSSNLVQHKRVHMPKGYQCDVCLRSFSMKANLARHQRKAFCKPVDSKPLICNVCDKVFEKSFLLKSHLRKHDTDRPFICDMCGQDFKYKSAIIRHLQYHTGFRPHKCPHCSKTFTHSGLIKPHLRTHTKEKPFKCTICNKTFAHKQNMERHKINHGRIKRLVCDICHKKFPRESRLIYHMKTHTREKFFDCGRCERQFTHKSNVMRHYERKHPGYTYQGTDTDAKVALRVWDRFKDTLKPHYDVYQQPEEILG